jgi:hypothetical protein
MNNRRTVRIAIDPELVKTRGAEIHWAWRLLLTTCGYIWEEVSLQDECDIAYILDLNQVPSAKICILADKRLWLQPANHQLEDIYFSDKLPVLRYKGLANKKPLVSTEAFQLLCNIDVIFQIYWLCTGQEERYWGKNRHGFHLLNGDNLYPRRVFNEAPVSQMISWFRESIKQICQMQPENIWAANYKAAACAGHDVDYPEIIRWLEPLRIIGRQGLDGIRPSIEVLTGKHTHWHFSSWVDFEKSINLRSAFYFVAEQGSLFKYASGLPNPFYDVHSNKFRDLFHLLNQEGFEIGLQASYDAYKSKEQFASEKQKLEEVCGTTIYGNRHHYYHLNPENPDDTLLIHEQIGLKYDTSLFHNYYLGWRRGLCHPYFPFHRSQRREIKSLQIPFAWMDDQLFGFIDKNPGNRKELLGKLVDRVTENEGCLAVNIHEYVFDDTLFPGWSQSYIDLWCDIASRRDYWLATPHEIADYWSKRYHHLLDHSHGLTLGIS